jgi:hypothetical protein
VSQIPPPSISWLNTKAGGLKCEWSDKLMTSSAACWSCLKGLKKRQRRTPEHSASTSHDVAGHHDFRLPHGISQSPSVCPCALRASILHCIHFQRCILRWCGSRCLPMRNTLHSRKQKIQKACSVGGQQCRNSREPQYASRFCLPSSSW